MNQHYIFGSVALLLCLAGVISLRLSWRRQRSALVLTGWLLLAASAVIWSLDAGIEFGLSYMLLAVSLAAWLMIAFNTERQASKVGNGTVDTATLPATTPLHKLSTFLVAGPLGAAASLLACAQITGGLSAPDSRGNAMVLTAFVFPLVWGAVAVWVCAVDRLVRVACILLAVATVCALSLLL